MTVPGRNIGGIVVTQFNLNPVLQIVTWLLLAIMTLLLVFRLLATFFLKEKRELGLEDIFVLVSYVCRHLYTHVGKISYIVAGFGTCRVGKYAFARK